MTTAAHLQRLRELAEAATAGPWEVPDGQCIIQPDGTYIIGDPECEPRQADLDYIAACSPDVIAALLDHAEALRGALAEVLATRAGKLMRRGVPFFVVAADEPYAAQVVDLIRQSEQERWTPEDAAWANAALAWKRPIPNTDEAGGWRGGYRPPFGSADFREQPVTKAIAKVDAALAGDGGAGG